jgi:hypothetical protein
MAELIKKIKFRQRQGMYHHGVFIPARENGGDGFLVPGLELYRELAAEQLANSCMWRDH